MSDFIKKTAFEDRQFLSINLILEEPALRGNSTEQDSTAVVKLTASKRHQTQAISVHPYYKEI